VVPAASAAWTALQTVVMDGQVSASGSATWTGRLTMDANRPAGRYRIVVEQYELIRVDGEATASAALSPAARERFTGERLVHQDIVGI